MKQKGTILLLLIATVCWAGTELSHAAEYTIEEAQSGSQSGGSSGGGGGGGSGGSQSTSAVGANCNEDSSGKVDIFDLSILLSNWGSTTSECDQNSDNKIDIFDFSILLSEWTSS